MNWLAFWLTRPRRRAPLVFERDREYKRYSVELVIEDGEQYHYVTVDGARMARGDEPVRSAEDALRLAAAYVARLRNREAQVAREWEQG